MIAIGTIFVILVRVAGVRGQLFCGPRNRRYLKPNLLMLKFEGSASKLKFPTGHTGVLLLCLLAGLFVVPASAQADFTLTAAAFDPQAISPGGTTASNITVTTNAGFTGPVALTCTVTPPVTLPPDDIPTCVVSPASLSAPGGAAATITTTGSTSTIGYTVTITGTDATGTQSQTQLVTVLSVVPQFTITVQTVVSPSSVVAGTGAEGVISVNPEGGYATPDGGIHHALLQFNLPPGHDRASMLVFLSIGPEGTDADG